MLVCYLDDSGTDPQNRIITIAGYAATDDQWAEFEEAVEPIFAEYNVDVLHGRDLHASDGEFKDWAILRKQAFVAKLCRTMSRFIPLGMIMSVLKEAFARCAAESGRKRTVTPYTFASNIIIDWVLTDIRVGKIANIDGVSFILESGNDHNAEVELNFHDVRRKHNLESVLKSISFIEKGSCRAIQMEDLFAFYSRRHGGEMERAPIENRLEMQRAPGMMLNIITESVPHRAFVATDFGPDSIGSHFFAGDS